MVYEEWSDGDLRMRFNLVVEELSKRGYMFKCKKKYVQLVAPTME